MRDGLPARHLTVLGAGLAGLAAGYYARLQGVPCTVLERSARVGGAAITLRQGPFAFDSGAHRFHDRDPEVTRDVVSLLDGRLDRVFAPSRVFSRGVFFDFPLSPLNLARGLGAAGVLRAGWDLALSRARRAAGRTFEDVVCRRYGRSIASRFLLGYTEKLWGRPPGRLVPEVSGGRLSGLDLRSVLAELILPARRKSAHLDGVFYYPRDGGIGTISERLADAIGRDSIRLHTSVTALVVEGNEVRSLQAAGRHLDVPGVLLSTLPLTRLVTMLTPSPPPEVLEAVGRLTFRSLVVVALFLNRPSVSRDATVYFPDPEFVFTRVYEPRNRNPRLAPPGQTSIVAEIPCTAGDRRWREKPAPLVRTVTEQLTRAGLIEGRDVVGHAVHRIEHAYPVLDTDAGEPLAVARRFLDGIGNLVRIGRSGSFAYSHIHHQLRSARDAVSSLVRSVWSGNEP